MGRATNPNAQKTLPAGVRDLPGSSFAAEFGGVDAMGNYTGASAGSAPEDPPPKASAATRGTATKTFVGLIAALNKQEQDLVQKKVFDVANVYSLEFAPKSLGDAIVTKPGTPNKNKTPMQSGTTGSDKVDPERQAMVTTVRTFGFAAGTPIVQIIDQIMRNSEYIGKQATVTIDEEKQQTEEQVPTTPPASNSSTNGDTGQQLAWYKINVSATPIGDKPDPKRNDFAYNIKYVVSAYGINRMVSEYFPEGRYRGSHKSYNYWFTGMNTQVLNFEQEFNSLYTQVLTNPNLVRKYKQMINNREIVPTVYQSASEQSRQSAEGLTNEIAANAADYLYNPADQGKIRLKIIGDPAWLQQGELVTGLSTRTFSFSPFNDDGTINFDAQEIAFDINWNRPADYNLNTGLMEVGKKNRQTNTGASAEATESARYRAVTCKSTFRQGRFEQELEGRLLMVPVAAAKPNTTSDTARTSNPASEEGYPEDTARSPDVERSGQLGDATNYFEGYPGQNEAVVDSDQIDYEQYSNPTPLPAQSSPPDAAGEPVDTNTTAPAPGTLAAAAENSIQSISDVELTLVSNRRATRLAQELASANTNPNQLMDRET